MNTWYEYVLITGTRVFAGRSPDDYAIDVESGGGLVDASAIGNNDEPATMDTWIFEEFAPVATGTFAQGCGGGLLGYELDNAGAEIFAPYYDEIVALFRQYQEAAQQSTAHCSAAVLTRWRCKYSIDYFGEHETTYELIGEMVLPQQEVQA